MIENTRQVNFGTGGEYIIPKRCILCGHELTSFAVDTELGQVCCPECCADHGIEEVE